MEPDVEAFRRKFSRELKTGLLSMLVMLAIERGPGPTYGYAIIRALEEQSQGKFRFPEGTVYPILSSLSGKGLLEAYWGDSLEGPRRKYYRMTPAGSAALRVCLKEWSTTSEMTDEIVDGLGGPP